jgi:hypothetical protein
MAQLVRDMVRKIMNPLNIKEKIIGLCFSL